MDRAYCNAERVIRQDLAVQGPGVAAIGQASTLDLVISMQEDAFSWT